MCLWSSGEARAGGVAGAGQGAARWVAVGEAQLGSLRASEVHAWPLVRRNGKPLSVSEILPYVLKDPSSWPVEWWLKRGGGEQRPVWAVLGCR